MAETMIGVFDSGLGGLTILKALTKQFPDEKFLYFGDNAYAPYGHRDDEQILALTRQGVEYLFEKGCDLVIIACNTACAIALRSLQQGWLVNYNAQRQAMKKSSVNVIGVFIPLIEAITGRDWQLSADMPYAPHRDVERVGFFATRATVNSHCFVDEMHRLAPHIQVIQQACHRLVDFIEADAPQEFIDKGIERYCHNLGVQAKAAGVDLAVLGCTHYELVADIFRNFLPEKTKIVHQPDAVAQSLSLYLNRHSHFREKNIDNNDGHRNPLQFITSGDPDFVSPAATKFWGEDVKFTYLRDEI